MKIVYLIDGLGAGGAERSLAELVTPLRQRGVELSVICLTVLREGVHDELMRNNVDITILAATSFVGRVREVRRMLLQRRPDVLHTTLFVSDVIGRLAAFRLPVPVVASVVSTSYDASRRGDPLVNQTALRAYQRVDAITARYLTSALHAVSPSVADAIVRDLGYPSARIHVIPRGRDPERLGLPTPTRRQTARGTLGLTADEFVAVHVGRQEWAKGLDTLFTAIGALARSGQPIRLLQAGRSGAASEQLGHLIEREGLSESVLQLGHRSDIPEILAAADVFVFPSRYEGMPGAVLEAMALGLPIIASDIPPVRDMVSDDFALLVTVDSPEALAAALKHLKSNSARRQQMSSAARGRFEENFTLERVADMTARFYDKTASAGRGRNVGHHVTPTWRAAQLVSAAVRHVEGGELSFSTRRVFLDIGAHFGETLEETAKPKWQFDSITCFEPASACWPSIEARCDDRVTLARFGLWDRDTEAELHDPGAIGASLSQAKAVSSTVETCQVRDAASWFAEHVDRGDTVFAKLNIEGAECDVLDRLVASGEIHKIDHLLVHFDVLKIPSERHRAAVTARQLDAAGVDWIDARRVMFGRSHSAKTANWLAYAEAGRWERLWRLHGVRLRFRLRQVAYRVRERIRSRA